MYKEGDVVKVRNDLYPNTKYGGDVATHNMCAYAGLYVTISSVQGVRMNIQGDAIKWNWSAEMFESVKPKLFKLL